MAFHRSLQNTPTNPISQATPTTFDLNLRNEKLFDLHMFTSNITTGIVIVNGYRRQ